MDLSINTEYGKCWTPAGLRLSLRKEPRRWLRCRWKLALRIPEGSVVTADYRGLGRWRWVLLLPYLVATIGARRALTAMERGWGPTE